jgi:hypothetical protein
MDLCLGCVPRNVLMPTPDVKPPCGELLHTLLVPLYHATLISLLPSSSPRLAIVHKTSFHQNFLEHHY